MIIHCNLCNKTCVRSRNYEAEVCMIESAVPVPCTNYSANAMSRFSRNYAVVRVGLSGA